MLVRVLSRFLLFAQLIDQLTNRSPFDELHRIEVHTALTPNAVDGNNVRMMQLRGGAGFVFEPNHLPPIKNCSEG